MARAEHAHAAVFMRSLVFSGVNDQVVASQMNHWRRVFWKILQWDKGNDRKTMEMETFTHCALD